MARRWLAPDVHVRNAGVAAYGLPQQVQRLALLEDRIEPGDLVLFTPISNDLERTLGEFTYVSRFLFRRFGGERVEVLPELRDGALVTARLDTPANRVRALLYHAATGHPPFEGENAIAIGFAHCSEAPRPPRELEPDVSERLSDMLLRALAKEPKQRPASAAEFRVALG